MLNRIIILVMCLSSSLAMALQTESSSAVSNQSSDNNGDIRFIRDNLTVFMHAGPGREFRILGTVEAGSKITLLEHNQDKGFAEIIDDKQRTGWVEDENVVSQRSMREILPETQKRLQQVNDELAQAQQLNQDLNQQIAELSLSNQQLQQRYDTLNDTYVLLRDQQDAQDQSSQKEWFTRGGMIALAGIILGVIVTYMPKRKRRSDNWM
ncbi:TIGR04211 family SH3 domain-containing protein [Neptunicella sp. SCSIO 80796]|uniref:TIGR04211 family SH3 domain-containing protein n=1 Tax=Neptunicella plasticusilytica TaxID=3117012 RepID=UPI003A4D8995